jgi:hypothetical protein
MNADRFDAAAISLADGLSRRRVLRGLVAGIVSVVTTRTARVRNLHSARLSELLQRRQ